MSMEEFVLPISPSRKRPAPDDDISNTSTPNKMAKSNPAEEAASTPSTSPKQIITTPKKPTSPAMSALTSPAMTIQPPTPLGSTKGSTKDSTNGTTPGKKKRKTKQEMEEEKKIKEAEKEAKRIAAEEKKRLKEEQDHIRNEEKRKKAEELDKKKREKEHEKAEKQREKDLKAQAKEEEKQKKIDEQNKKERAQLKLKNFFAAKPTTTSGTIRVQDSDSIAEQAVESGSPKKSERSTYESFFLPFNLPSHTTLPSNYHDRYQSTNEEPDLTDPGTISSFPKVSSRRTRAKQLPVEEIFSLLQGTSKNPIDLTSNSTQEQYALQLLDETPMKYLHFEEDVRPPYFGTWTKPLTPQQWRHLARNPNYNLESLDYDYDSEAEWEEPEEGEDLVSEDGEEEDDGEDDMAGFLDDEELSRPAHNRGLCNNDLIPVCSGLQWEDVKGNLHPANGGETADFSDYGMVFLIDSVTVDPLSIEYWAPHELSTKNKSLAAQSGTSRPALVDKTKQMNGVVPTTSSSLKQPRMVQNEDIDQFKAAIAGQDLTKIAMVEHLKKMFPKLQKDAIVNTLAAVAERESKKANAKWRLKGTS